MEKVKIDLSCIVKRVGGNTIIYTPSQNVCHHIAMIYEKYPELLEANSIYVVHIDKVNTMSVYVIERHPTLYPYYIDKELELWEISDELKIHIAEVASSGYMYYINTTLGTNLALHDNIDIVSNIVDGYRISEVGVNTLMLDGVPHLIVFNNGKDIACVGDNADLYIQSYINKGYNTIIIHNLHVSDNEFYQSDVLIEDQGNGNTTSRTKFDTIDINAISTEFGIYMKVRDKVWKQRLIWL